MTRLLALVGIVLGLAACSNPRAHAGVHVTPRGVSVTPALTTSIGALDIAVTP
ncbi:hypothetical protein [Albidovulum sp.]